MSVLTLNTEYESDNNFVKEPTSSNVVYDAEDSSFYIAEYLQYEIDPEWIRFGDESMCLMDVLASAIKLHHDHGLRTRVVCIGAVTD